MKSARVTQHQLWAQAVDQLLAAETLSYEPDTFSSGVAQPDLSPAAGRLAWALTDHQGSVVGMYETRAERGSNLAWFAYDAHGTYFTLANSTGVGSLTSSGYAGREFDEFTRLYNNRAREYDPSTGRFQSPDPLGFAAGDTNLYRYAFNSPTHFTDPSGKVIHIATGAGIGAAVGAGAYLVGWWIHGGQFSWTDFGVSALSGAAAGAVGVATLGAGLLFSGAAAGATGGGLSAGLTTAVHGGSAAQVAQATFAGAAVGGIAGGVGGYVAGRIAGGLSTQAYAGASLARGVAADAAGGFVAGAIGGGYYGFAETGTLGGAVRGTLGGGVFGGLTGAVLGAGTRGWQRTWNLAHKTPKTTSVSASGPGVDEPVVFIEGRIDRPRHRLHTLMQLIIADEMAASGWYKRVGMSMKLSEIIGKPVNGTDFVPDNWGITHDNKIDLIEISSPWQTRAQLRAKLDEMSKLLPPDRQGDSGVIMPPYKRGS